VQNLYEEGLDMNNHLMVVIYCADSYEYDGELFYKSFLKKAKKEELSGVSVLRAIEGFGGKGKIRGSSLADLFEGLPIIIEFVDEREKVLAFLEKHRDMLQGLRIYMTEVAEWK